MVTITREGLVDRNRQVHDLSDEVLSVNLEPSDAHHSTPNQRFDLDQSHEMTPLPIAQPEHRFRVGVIVPAVITDDYIGAVVRGISKAVKAQGGTMVLNTQSAEHRDSLSALMLGPRRCDGVILVVPLNMQRVLEMCDKYKRPFVLVDYEDDVALQRFPTVTVDNILGTSTLMQHLLELGHRRIGFITGMMRHASARERLEAYQDSLEAAGLDYDPQLVISGDWLVPSGYMAMQKLLRLPNRPTAVVASNDLMALGAIDAANEAGLTTGRDISITGFDDIPLAASSFPALTTIRQPSEEMGAAAANMMLRTLSGETLNEPHVRMEGTFVQRKSTCGL